MVHEELSDNVGDVDTLFETVVLSLLDNDGVGVLESDREGLVVNECDSLSDGERLKLALLESEGESLELRLALADLDSDCEELWDAESDRLQLIEGVFDFVWESDPLGVRLFDSDGVRDTVSEGDALFVRVCD